jgi:ABC-type multidrug transport system fused ATPase/permease subunit
MPPVRLGIRFESITFGYRRGERILRKVNLQAKPGTITALIGPTGSGKSTLMALLLRLYDPDEGSIEIDGVDLREIELEGLRAGISIALQENLLFRATIRENIAFASPSATDAQIREAARVACADTFVRELPLGYDTPLGERGTKLSTGQRQRLSIARAVLKDTPILILDEPTASLDAETELAVLDNLAEWGRGRAIFIITHRLSTIRRADQIVVLRDGEVLEEGSHQELMRREGGGYRRLVEIEDRAARAGVEQG